MNDIAKTMLMMFLALSAYSAAVTLDKKAGKLMPANLAMLWAGFCLNAIGFGLMTRLEADSGSGFSGIGRIIGILAIVVVLIHAIWGTAILVLKDEKSEKIFHRDGTLLWKIWLVPFVLSLILAVIG